MYNSNWDNLRFVLTVANHGSVSAAARVLGVNHATVLRRVATFEATHGGPVFEKTATGYRVLPGRAQVIDAAREVENAVFSVERLMHGARAPLRGAVRVSSTDTFCQVVLPPLVARLHEDAAQLQIELMSNNSHVDFTRLEADISVRPALKLPDEMRGDTSVRLAFRVYGLPDLAEDIWLGLCGALARSAPAAWMAENIAPEQIAGRADSFLVLRDLALRGMGLAVLPVIVGDRVPGLCVRSGLLPEISVPIWVATHAELHDVPRFRIVRERILDYLASKADLLSGTAAP